MATACLLVFLVFLCMLLDCFVFFFNLLLIIIMLLLFHHFAVKMCMRHLIFCFFSLLNIHIAPYPPMRGGPSVAYCHFVFNYLLFFVHFVVVPHLPLHFFSLISHICSLKQWIVLISKTNKLDSCVYSHSVTTAPFFPSRRYRINSDYAYLCNC